MVPKGWMRADIRVLPLKEGDISIADILVADAEPNSTTEPRTEHEAVGLVP